MIDGCEKKHHARGYCKAHYMQYVLKPRYAKMVCSVDGCDAPVSSDSGKLRMCSKHYTRVKRNGDPHTCRIRRWASCRDAEGDPLDVEHKRPIWAAACLGYYGDTTCMKCRGETTTPEVHHRVQISDGGINTVRNGIVLCPNCHRAIHRGKNSYRRLAVYAYYKELSQP